MPPPIRPSRTTLLTALRNTARRVGPGRPAITDASGTLSFEALIERAIVLAPRIATRLRQIEPSETIGVYQLSGSETLALLLAAALAGRTLAFLNPQAPRRLLAAMLLTARVRRILCPVDQMERLNRIVGDESFADLGVSVTAYDELLAPATLLERARARWHALRHERTDGHALAVFFAQDDRAHLRGALFTEENFLAACRQAIHRRLWTVEDVALCAQPLHQPAALLLGLLAPVLAGAHVITLRRPSAYRGVTRAASELRATVLTAAPAYLAHYARAARRDDFAMLRRVVAIGEPLDASVAAAIARSNVVVHEVYFHPLAGLVALSPGDMDVGSGPLRLARGTKVKLVATRDRIPRGVLHVRGPQLARHYLDEAMPGIAQPVASAIGTDWHATGEVFDVLPHRFIRWVPGRSAFLHVAGESIPLIRAEKLARGASPECTHAAVTSVSGPRQFVVLFTTDARLTRADLAQLADALGEPRVIVPRLVIAMRALPRNHRGRVDYELLRRNSSGPPERRGSSAAPPATSTVSAEREQPTQRLDGILTAINSAFTREVTGS